jgi:hypothetical protein
MLDDALLAALRAERVDGNGRHSHPQMLLSEVIPVAGYATGVLGLDHRRSE